MEASCHVICSHFGAPYFHTAEDGRFVCPFADTLDCSVSFIKTAEMINHITSAHSGKRLPCPLASFGCSSTCNTYESMAGHVRTKHRHGTFPCPSAETANCGRIFKSASAAHDHAKSHQPTRQRYPCPLAHQFQCEATFVSTWHAKSHANNVHRTVRVPCPLAEEANCAKTFGSEDNARKHAQMHQQTRRLYPCPLADEHNCSKTFLSKVGAFGHADREHRRLRKKVPCPLAEEANCSRTFSNISNARSHAKVHDPAREKYPCPLADGENCTAMFSSAGHAREHVKIHNPARQRHPCPFADEHNCHMTFADPHTAAVHGKDQHSKPFPCPRLDCTARFVTAKDAWEHADHPEHPAEILFLCPVSMCSASVSRKRHAKRTLKLHLKYHIERGDMEDDTDFIPQQVEALPLHSDLPLYPLIRQYDIRDLADEVQSHESPEQLPGKSGDTVFGGALSVDSVSASEYEDGE
jgi:hypothetical protein